MSALDATRSGLEDFGSETKLVHNRSVRHIRPQLAEGKRLTRAELTTGRASGQDLCCTVEEAQLD